MTPHDPVEEFFARERREVRDLAGGPDHWEGILRESRRPARRPWLPYLGAAAAAAVVVGAIGYGATANRDDHTTPATASHQVTATVTTTVTAPATKASPGPARSSTGSATSAPVGPLPAPASFVAASISNAGDGHVYALGSARCSGKACVAVVGSEDDGATWTTRASFEHYVTGGARSTPDADNQLSGIRFANPRVGYVYGSTVKRTDDGGAHWYTYGIGDQRVLSLETDGTTVWFVTAGSCRHAAGADARGCSDLAVWSAPVSATHATRVKALGQATPVESAWLSMDGSDAYVNTASANPSVRTVPERVSGRPGELSRPKGCADAGGIWASGTARADGHLVAVCRSAGAPDETYAVASSADRGATWSTAQPAPDLGTPGPAGVWVTAADPDHLVAVTGGLATSSAQPGTTSLLSSNDAGRTWSAPGGADSSDSWSWAGAAGGRIVYALGAGPGSFELSTDSGATFVARPFRH